MVTPSSDLRAKQMYGQTHALKSSSTVSPANHAILQNQQTMVTYLLANGYTNATIAAMTPNDVVFACKEKLGIA